MSEPAPAVFDVVLFYKYTDIVDPSAVIAYLEALCGPDGLNLIGRVLIANEGVNGTLAGPHIVNPAGKTLIDAFTEAFSVCELADFSEIDFKTSTADTTPFPTLLLKHVPEIISTGGTIPPPDPSTSGVHLTPAEFHAALCASTPADSVLIDVRCSKEYSIGHFEGAIDPNIRTFAEFPHFVKSSMDSLAGKRVFMYCTGGIRCEKASAYMKSAGFGEVYQLKGGIHRYLETYEDGGLFQGRNFVFDKRVAMAPSAASPAVVGNCVDCSAPFDGFAGDVVCTVCRELVLVCPACRERDQGEYHCSSHRELKSCYFTNLNHFTLPQLAGQLAELQSLLTVALTQGRRLKNRRRTLSRQIEKVEARISALESGEASVEARVEKCRTCGDAGCHGACWGFWARGEPGKVEVSASRRAL